VLLTTLLKSSFPGYPQQRQSAETLLTDPASAGIGARSRRKPGAKQTGNGGVSSRRLGDRTVSNSDRIDAAANRTP